MVSQARTTAFTSKCEHCQTMTEVIIVPMEGRAFRVPRSVLDQLGRIAASLDDMDVKIIQLHRPKNIYRMERPNSTEGPAPSAPSQHSNP